MHGKLILGVYPSLLLYFYHHKYGQRNGDLLGHVLHFYLTNERSGNISQLKMGPLSFDKVLTNMQWLRIFKTQL